MIAFADADVQIPCNWIEIIAGEFERDKGLEMIYGPVCFSDLGWLEKSSSKFLMLLFLGTLSVFGLHNPVGSNMAVRRKAFEEIKGFNTKLVTAEDLDLARRIKGRGKVKFCRNMVMNVSARRVKKWGLLKFIFFHLANGLKFQLTGNAKEEYAEVR